MRYERELEELYRRGTDYGELLKRGFVQRLVPEPDEWRAEIRRQARRDQVRIRTFVLDEDIGLSFVYAVVITGNVGTGRLRASFQMIEARRRAATEATELGHELEIWEMSRHRTGTRCTRCGARLHIEVFEDHRKPIVDGEAVEDECA